MPASRVAMLFSHVADQRPIILFDGECGLCHRAVRFVLRRDRAGHFRFAALQSLAARRLLRAIPVDIPQPGEAGDTVVLLDPASGRVWLRSAAALRIARRLRWPWPLLAIGLALPRCLRDAVYRAVASRRSRGAAPAVCDLLAAQAADRFLSDGTPRS